MWFYFALATAFFSAISVIFDKRILKSASPSVLTWCTLVLSTPIIAAFAVKGGVPKINTLFIAGAAGSVLFYIISQIAQFRAMKMADLSAIYPLVSLGPVFTLLVAFFPPLYEKPGPVSIVGIVIILSGTYILNISNAREGLLKPIRLLFENKASALMVISVLVGSVIIAFDKLAINNTAPQNTTFVLLVENIVVIVCLSPVILLKNKNAMREILDNKKPLIILGVLNAFSTILAFMATGSGNVGAVAAILKVQTLFVLLSGYIFLKDKPKPESVIGSIIMILGIVLIKTGL